MDAPTKQRSYTFFPLKLIVICS